VINNSTNINKTNNRTSPQSIEHKKRALHMAFEIQVMARDRHKHVAGLNLASAEVST
jgi:hypothetical protein